MFKKIEIWILYLIVFLGIPITIGFGVLVRQELIGSTKLGRVSKTALFLAEIPMNLKKIFLSNQLQVAGERFPLLDNFNGTPNSSESYLLLSRYDRDLKEGIVELVDLMNFKVLHTWNPDINKFNDSVKQSGEFKYLNRDGNNSRFLLRHPLLLKDGGLVFQDSSPLMKIDECSNLIFQNTQDRFHHSIETDIDGNIWVPSYMYPQTLPVEKVGRDIVEENGYIDDGIVKLSPNGEVLFEKSVSQIFIDNNLESLLFSSGDYRFVKDPIHLNDIQPVDFDGEYWKKGDVFLSINSQSMLILYRPLTNQIIWHGKGPFSRVHDVDILDDYRISAFHNNYKFFVNTNVVDGNNEVIIYDFNTNKYSTYLEESLVENDVRTKTNGRSQILPNGDLFIEETDFGRTLYFDSDGSLRWTHVNRADNGNVYGIGWSRILYTPESIKIVKNFLEARGKCND
ncbi:arylsulfotransferase family protein [Prochlorococcus marinus]|uniref:Arylsulfotransferase (ASST) n=1 Tax=Prochlorococcus marinus (strain AS9601) TaxID=146891 RepID=A2BTA6_PROMS|nr:arylsulfotransferase family protein [Prochlorococcus marinus]ABM71017.1 Hypothetical protein A9601_17341 [Prochlorococcus marinus str. AS9601]